MKKTILFLIPVLFIAFNSPGQTATSVANGNWYMPSTWDCMCIPTAAYTVNINHDVILDNDFGLSGGAINIGANGILRENVPGRYLVMNSGSITNNGKIKISRAGFYGGSFDNNDSCLIYSVFFSGAKVHNNGSITEVDSLFIQSDFYNENSGVVNAFRVTVNDSLENNGTLNVSELLNLNIFINNSTADFVNFYSTDYTRNNNLITFDDFSNSGTFDNYASMSGSDNVSNTGHFYNENAGWLWVGNDFSNVDSIHHLAYFNNEGYVYIGGNFYNRDTINGTTGRFCISQSSNNAGIMLGSFNFYDFTTNGPPSLNTGSISNLITYNALSCDVGVGKNDNPESELVVYPNPAADYFCFEFSEAPSNANITLTDVLGSIIFSQQVTGKDKVIFNRDNTPSGLYIYHIVSGPKVFTGKIILQ